MYLKPKRRKKKLRKYIFKIGDLVRISALTWYLTDKGNNNITELTDPMMNMSQERFLKSENEFACRLFPCRD
jgi:hypothetical protein